MDLPSTLEELVRQFAENTGKIHPTDIEDQEPVSPLYKTAFSASMINCMANTVDSASPSEPRLLTCTQLLKSLVLGFLSTQTQQASPTSTARPQEFTDLPTDLLRTLKVVCGFAYTNLLEARYTFDLDDFESSELSTPFDALGLIQPVEVLGVFGPTVKYAFLHQCLQEFLAALYLADLPRRQQIAVVSERFFRRVPTFLLPAFAGITKLKNRDCLQLFLSIVHTGKDSRHQDGIADVSADPRLLLLLLNCVYESQRSDLCQVVANRVRQQTTAGLMIRYDFGNTQLMPIDCMAVGYFASKLSDSRIINILSFELCYLADEDIEILMKPFLSTEDSSSSVVLDFRGNKVTHNGTASIGQLIRSSSIIFGLNLQVNWMPTETNICVALKNLIEALSRNSSVKYLGLTGNCITSEHVYHLTLMLASCKNLASLELRLNNLAKAMPLLAAALEYNTSLVNLELVGCCITKKELLTLGRSLGRNKTLKSLDLCDNPFSSSDDLPLFLSLLGQRSALTTLKVTCLQRVDQSVLEATNAGRARAGVERLQIDYRPPDITAKLAVFLPFRKRSSMKSLHSDSNDLTERQTPRHRHEDHNITSADFAVFKDHPPELHELCDAAAEIADLYDQIGMGLGLTHGQLRVIRTDTAGRPNQMQQCLTEVFSYWRSGRTLPYTWETFASVLLQPRLAPVTKLLLTELHKNLARKYC